MQDGRWREDAHAVEAAAVIVLQQLRAVVAAVPVRGMCAALGRIAVVPVQVVAFGTAQVRSVYLAQRAGLGGSGGRLALDDQSRFRVVAH